MYSYIIIHSSINRHLDYSLSWLSIMNVWCRCLFEAVFISLDTYAPEMGLLDHLWTSFIACPGILILIYTMAAPIYIPFNIVKDAFFSGLPHVPCLFFLLESCHPNECEMLSHWIFIYILGDFKHFSHTFLFLHLFWRMSMQVLHLLRVFVVELCGFFVYLGSCKTHRSQVFPSS